MQQNYENLLLTAEEYASNGDFLSAFEIYQKLTNIYNDSPEILSNFATCAFQISNYALADDLFNKSLSLINYCDEQQQKVLKQKISATYATLLYNQGCDVAKSIHKAEQLSAIELFKKAINYNHDDYKPYYNIACCYINIDHLSEGIDYLNKTIVINPHHAEAHFALSQYYQQTNDLARAKQHLDQSVQSKTHNQFIAEYNYGVLEYQRGHYSEALEHYHKSLQLNPHSFATCYNTASLYQKLKNYPKAIEYYKQALTINPEDETCKYLLSCLSSTDVPAQAPVEYIENLFDHYANYFEQELINDLNYKTPELLYDLFINNTQAINLNILDLGCGTGLIGQQFKSLSNNLTGVDISKKMLNIAASKNIYNNLSHCDIEEFLINNNKLYDLIILGDVLVYYGDLKKIFAAIKNNLPPKGYVLFSIETLANSTNQPNYLLDTTGRYKHNLNYIYSLATEQFTIINQTHSSLRNQADESVPGSLVLLQT